MSGEHNEFEELRRAASALGDRTRFQILLRLHERPRRVGELVDLLGLSQPLVSHHLAVLVAAGWARKDGGGKRCAYSLAPGSGEPMIVLQRLLASVASRAHSSPPAGDVVPPDVVSTRVDPAPTPLGRPQSEIEDYLL